MVVRKKIVRNGFLFEVLTLNQEKDSIIIETKSVVIGASEILSCTVVGKIPTLLIEFSGTVDSVNWTDWTVLSLSNLQKLNLNSKHPFQIKYRLTCRQTGYNSILSIELKFRYEVPEIPDSYESLPFSSFFPFLNEDSLLWGVNVLEKFYKPGIVPNFIERGDNKNWGDIDFLDFWWASIYLNSLRISYNKIYKETLFRKDLLKDFLKQRGLVIGEKEDLGELYYLTGHFLNEIRRRGTSLILEENLTLPSNYSGIKVSGELLRLLNLTKSKVEFSILTSEEIGWYVGSFSPTYPSGTSSLSLTKGYEFTKGILDLSKYPVLNGQFVSITNSVVNGGSTDKCMVISPSEGESAGIGYSGQNWEDFKIPVNVHFSYEITFLLKKGRGQLLEVGVDCFNDYGANLKSLNLITNLNQESTKFFSKTLTLSDSIETFSFIRCIIWSIDYGDEIDSTPTIGIGDNLRFRRKETTSIIPRILVTGKGGVGVYIYDFKVKPCLINNSEFISQENLLYLRSDNKNGELSDEKVREYIDQNLIPYNMELNFKTKEVI